MAARNQNTRRLRAGTEAACGFATSAVGAGAGEVGVGTGTVLTECPRGTTRLRPVAGRGVFSQNNTRARDRQREFASGNLSMSFSAMELMICSAARELDDGKSVAVGTGLPCAAAMLAQRTHAPNLVIMFEAGGVAPQLPTMPVSVGDSTTFHRAVMATSTADVMQVGQRGLVDYTFLGGAQIDAHGNLNSTVIGPYEKPKVRLPGSGGAC